MSGLVAGLDYDIPAEAVGMPLQENQLPPRPRMRPEDTAHIDMRIKPESRPRALKHLAAIRDRLSQKKEPVSSAKEAIQRKTRLLDMLGGEAEQTRKNLHKTLFGEVAEYPVKRASDV